MSLLSDKRKARKTPWHFWLVAVLAVLWNGFGVVDFVMTQTQNAQYMASFTQEQLDYFYSLPLWLVITWGVGVWGGLLGAVFLLFKKRLAVWCFFASLIAVVTTTIYNLFLSGAPEVMDDSVSLWLTVAIAAIAIFLFFYAGIMNKNRYLR